MQVDTVLRTAYTRVYGGEGPIIGGVRIPAT